MIERLLAICFSLLILETVLEVSAKSSCDRHRRLMGMRSMHDQTIWAYRARVRLYRGEGKRFQDAQRLALVGNV
jgi:hypothetical protein